MMPAARRRLAAADLALAGDPANDLYAKTHAGTWDLFYVTFAQPGDFDAALVRAARNLQPKRERADYEAWPAAKSDASDAIDLARRFVDPRDALFA